MIDPGRLLVRDFASMLLDVVPDPPCTDAGFACAFREVVDCLVPLTLAVGVCVVIGFVLAISVSVVVASFERRRGPVVSRPRLLSGPVWSDGHWIRLVEDERGRRVELLDGATWRPAGREPGLPPIDVPIRTLSTS